VIALVGTSATNSAAPNVNENGNPDPTPRGAIASRNTEAPAAPSQRRAGTREAMSRAIAA